MLKQKILKQSRLEKLTLDIIHWMGTPQSILVHTILFTAVFIVYFIGVPLDLLLLVLTTAVSLEAIYLALFIQMTVNRNTRSLQDVEKDIDEIQEDVEDLGEDVDEISEDIEDIQEDFQEVGGDIDEIQGHVKELNEDVEDISEDIDKIHTKKQKTPPAVVPPGQSYESLEKHLQFIMNELTSLKDEIKNLKKSY